MAGAGSPEMLAEVETMGRPVNSISKLQNGSEVIRMPMDPSGASRLAARLRAPGYMMVVGFLKGTIF